MIRSLTLVLPLLLAGCDGLPRDAGGTRERVAATGVLRVGIALDGELPGADARAARLAAAVAADHHARVRRQVGGLEPLLARLEAGEIDLVIALVDEKSPWLPSFGVGPAIARTVIAERPHGLRPIVPAGENALLVRVWHHARAMGGRP